MKLKMRGAGIRVVVVSECVCKEVEITQLICYFAVRHVNWTKTCDQASKLSFFTYRGKHHIISILCSLFLKYNIIYLVIFLGGFFSLPKT